MLYEGMSDFNDYNGISLTYQSMNNYHEDLRYFCSHNRVLIVADEIHHVADDQTWGDAFRNAFEPAAHFYPRVIGYALVIQW